MPFSELYFNVDNGYLEGLVRGFKAGILTQGDYLNLVQCETLEGEPGYSSFICQLSGLHTNQCCFPRFHLFSLYVWSCWRLGRLASRFTWTSSVDRYTAVRRVSIKQFKGSLKCPYIVISRAVRSKFVFICYIYVNIENQIRALLRSVPQWCELPS